MAAGGGFTAAGDGPPVTPISLAPAPWSVAGLTGLAELRAERRQGRRLLPLRRRGQRLHA
eukprot:793587-Prorocentrum_minimum.AAC.1